jgi:uncharacterized protein (DUF427 family)
LSANPAGRFSSPLPDDIAYVEPHPRRVVATRDGAVVLDTEDVVLVHRRGQALSYAFRVEAVDGLPHEAEPLAAGYARVPWDAVDEWFEEGRKLVAYPPNPYHRVDCRPTKRRLRVSVGGELLVDTDDTVILFETGLAPKLYVAPHHVRTELLVLSDTVTYCNYKGYTRYWSYVNGTTRVDDVAWTYDEPLPESQLVKHMFSFEPTVVSVEAELPHG